MAIQIISKPDSIHIGDTVVIQARVLNRGGDSIVGAPIRLDVQNPDTIGIDTARQAVIGRLAGAGRVIAKSGNLASDVFTILVK